MRYVSITYFLLCVHVSLIIINSLGIFALSFAPNSDLLNAVGADTIRENGYSQTQVSSPVGFDLGDLVKSLFYMILVLGKAVFVFPVTLVQFGMPALIATAISIPIYSLYLYSLAQWIGNRPETSYR